jgi:hypothetical protein
MAEIERARTLTVQSSVRSDEDVGSGIDILSLMNRTADIIPPWWSKRRDMELRSFWKTVPYVASAMYAIQSKITNMPFDVRPRDTTIYRHRIAATRATDMLINNPEFGQGWDVAMGKFLEDVMGTDNGGFLEIIGAGDPAGPIVGAPVGFSHLDSRFCVRKSDPIYPVCYHDPVSSKVFKLHYSRVIYRSLMPSSRQEMYGVGFCSVSRCASIAQTLYDIVTYKQEKMGSRPPRQLIVGRGISADEILTAFRMANTEMDNQQLSRFSKTVAIGSRANNPELNIDLIDLASVPDGFNEETSTVLGIYAIALAFGVDAREFWPATASGATKADAAVQHMKARGKGLGHLLNIIERSFMQKLLPPYLEFRFDAQDDEQDLVRADISNRRSQARMKDLQTKSITTRVARLRMLDDGEISQEDFDLMELEDGRLEDGLESIALFESEEAIYQSLLRIPGASDPVSVMDNDAEDMIVALDKKAQEIRGMILAVRNAVQRWPLRRALSAVLSLRDMYASEQMKQNFESEEEGFAGADSNQRSSMSEGTQDPMPDAGQDNNFKPGEQAGEEAEIPQSREESEDKALPGDPFRGIRVPAQATVDNPWPTVRHQGRGNGSGERAS